MPRAKYKITVDDAFAAYTWLKNQRASGWFIDEKMADKQTLTPYTADVRKWTDDWLGRWAMVRLEDQEKNSFLPVN